MQELKKQFKGKNLSATSEQNKINILKFIKSQNICSRVEIAKATGLTQASITKIISTLIEQGILLETGFLRGQNSRRSIGLKINSKAFKFISIQLLRNSYRIALFDLDAELYEQSKEINTESKMSDEIFEEILSNIEQYKNKYENIISIGVTAPGTYKDFGDNIELINQIIDYEKVKVLKLLKQHFKSAIHIENNAIAGSLAEWWFGKYSMEKNIMVYISVNEGIRAGIIINGEVFRGTQGLAGKVGHISINSFGDFNEKCFCGNHGCLELYASTNFVVENTLKSLKSNEKSLLNQEEEINFEKIINSLRSADPIVVETIEIAATNLGYGIINIIMCYNPGVIVIGGKIAQAGEIFLQKLKDTVKSRVPNEIYDNLILDFSNSEIDSVLLGGATLAINSAIESPNKLILKSSVL